MIIHPPENTETKITHHTCEFHKKNPGENHAGCTCQTSYSLCRCEEKAEPNLTTRIAEKKLTDLTDYLGKTTERHDFQFNMLLDLITKSAHKIMYRGKNKDK